jgi:hypothetical protein
MIENWNNDGSGPHKAGEARVLRLETAATSFCNTQMKRQLILLSLMLLASWVFAQDYYDGNGNFYYRDGNTYYDNNGNFYFRDRDLIYDTDGNFYFPNGDGGYFNNGTENNLYPTLPILPDVPDFGD